MHLMLYLLDRDERGWDASAPQRGGAVGAVGSVMHHERTDRSSRSAVTVRPEPRPLPPTHRCAQSADLLRNDGRHFCPRLETPALCCGRNGTATAMLSSFN